MTTFPGSPRVLKGALVSFHLPDVTPRVIAFQYNPVTLNRSLQAQTAGGDDESPGPTRFKGAPVETISLEVEIDATDALEKEEARAITHGIHPQLAALEMLLYPSSAAVVTNVAKLALGVREIVAPLAPFTLFIHGHRRVLPVRLTEFSINEEAHDAQLNPIRAKVSLGLRVLSYNDLPSDHRGHAIFLIHQAAKEAMVAAGAPAGLETATGSGVRLF